MLVFLYCYSYISALADRVTVIFSTVFKESDDLIIAKVFLQVNINFVFQ